MGTHNRPHNGQLFQKITTELAPSVTPYTEASSCYSETAFPCCFYKYIVSWALNESVGADWLTPLTHSLSLDRATITVHARAAARSSQALLHNSKAWLQMGGAESSASLTYCRALNNYCGQSKLQSRLLNSTEFPNPEQNSSALRLRAW